MISKNYLSVLAQTHSGWVFDEGVQISETEVLGIEKNIGLLAMAHANDTGEGSPSHIAIQIIVDDMQVNLPMAQEQGDGSRSPASQCLFESIDNINDYLYSENQDQTGSGFKGISLCAVQFLMGQLSCICSKEMIVLQLHDGELTSLTQQSEESSRLGRSRTPKVEIVQHSISSDDIVIILNRNLYKSIEHEYLRVTLSRFGDNLAMALRQINTRAVHKGNTLKPAILLARINTEQEKSGGWLKRFGKS